jgi:hypothetical protein
MTFVLRCQHYLPFFCKYEFFILCSKHSSCFCQPIIVYINGIAKNVCNICVTVPKIACTHTHTVLYIQQLCTDIHNFDGLL